MRSYGVRQGAHGYLLDGAALSDPVDGEGANIRPPGLDTIQEFLVENNAPSAKFSRPTSIILTTRSGANQWGHCSRRFATTLLARLAPRPTWARSPR